MLPSSKLVSPVSRSLTRSPVVLKAADACTPKLGATAATWATAPTATDGRALYAAITRWAKAPWPIPAITCAAGLGVTLGAARPTDAFYPRFATQAGVKYLVGTGRWATV